MLRLGKSSISEIKWQRQQKLHIRYSDHWPILPEA